MSGTISRPVDVPVSNFEALEGLDPRRSDSPVEMDLCVKDFGLWNRFDEVRGGTRVVHSLCRASSATNRWQCDALGAVGNSSGASLQYNHSFK